MKEKSSGILHGSVWAVATLMSSPGAAVRERLAASRAQVRPDPGVRPHVGCELP